MDDPDFNNIHFEVTDLPTETPFFSAGLLVTAPNGTYGGIRRSNVFQAYDDRIEIDRMKIYYPYLTDLRVYENILHVAYVASDGKQDLPHQALEVCRVRKLFSQAGKDLVATHRRLRNKRGPSRGPLKLLAR